MAGISAAPASSSTHLDMAKKALFSHSRKGDINDYYSIQAEVGRFVSSFVCFFGCPLRALCNSH